MIEKVKDPRVEGVTLTRVHLSDDLKHAKVYYSVLGGEDVVEQSQRGLDSATGYIKREIAVRIHLRSMPEIVFKHDPTLEWGGNLEKIFHDLKKEPAHDDG